MELTDTSPLRALRTRLQRLLPVLLGLGLFVMGLWALNQLLATIDVWQVIAQMKATPWPMLAAAVAATATSYTALIGYDFWALAYLGKHLPLRTVALGGFLGYAFGNTVGVSVISGGAVRYRIYSAVGLSAVEVAALSSYVAVAMGTGLTLVGLIALGLHPAALAGALALPATTIRLGTLAIAIGVIALVIWLSVSEHRLRLRGVEIAMPSLRILAGQLVVVVFDSTMAAAALYVLMPAGTPPFPSFLAIYAAATMIGVVSHVPGGVGVFETVVIAALPAPVPLDEVAAGLLAFRIIYFLLPFALAFAIVSINEARLAGGLAARLLGEVSEPMRSVLNALSAVVPRLSGIAVLGLGAWLVLVALIPSLLPPGDEPDLVGAILMEGSTLAPILVGTMLIALSHGLARRVSFAYVTTLIALAIGVGDVLLNEHDYDSAALLVAAMLALVPFRSEFHRSAALFEGAFGPRWIALVLGIVAAAGAVFLLAHAATPYSNALWIDFSGRSPTPRALRAGMLGSIALLTFLLYLALRPARRLGVSDDTVELDTLTEILAAQDEPKSWLALTGDKQVMLSAEQDAFIMYACRRDYCVVLGDPVGPDDAAHALAWDFFERAGREGLKPIFYEVSQHYLPLWIEMGLSLHKVGEEAIVDLRAFSLSGGRFKTMRADYNRARREGLTLELTAPPHSEALLRELRDISDSWLAEQRGAEKGYSVGRFDPAYLKHCELALVRRNGRIVAFASMLGATNGRRGGIDLMRYRPDAGSGLMQFLFLALIERLQERGVEEFSLGLVILAGLPDRPSATRVSRLGNLIYHHGGAFYNFEGLRRFKQKFHPEWRPRYAALPPGVSPYLAFAEIAVLISGSAGNSVAED